MDALQPHSAASSSLRLAAFSRRFLFDTPLPPTHSAAASLTDVTPRRPSTPTPSPPKPRSLAQRVPAAACVHRHHHRSPSRRARRRGLATGHRRRRPGAHRSRPCAPPPPVPPQAYPRVRAPPMRDWCLQVISFASGLRTVAMLSCNVSEKLTISAGADLEKKATAKFRYELVRLLNLAFYSYTLMLKGFKLVTPPASLVPLEGGVMEVHAARGRRGLPRLHVQAVPPPTACPTPTLLTCCAGCLPGRGSLRGLVPHRDGLQVDYQPVRAATPSTAHHRYPGAWRPSLSPMPMYSEPEPTIQRDRNDPVIDRANSRFRP